jgi:hypothetical protein
MSSRSSIQDIINTALSRESEGNANTMIVSNHLAQMVLFGIRQGVEFYPAHDPNGDREKFITEVVERNRLDLYLQAIWEAFVGTGSVLFYLRPYGNTYDIYWYQKDQFEPYYKDGGRELERVIINYPYKVRSHLSNMEAEKWVRLEITETEIRKGEYENNPGFGINVQGWANEEVTTNTLGIVPCVIVDNNPVSLGRRGTNDFDWLAGQIEKHNDLMTAINSNISFFGNPTLVTTRSSQEVTEAAFNVHNTPRTISSGAAFQNSRVQSTYKYDPTTLSEKDGALKIKPVIGNVEPDERFGFIQPDAISGDQNRWALQYEELIRTALGGVSENGINSGATAFEIKSLFGRAASTAMRKAVPLYTYGLCKLFELAIAAEEFLFERSFEQAIKWDAEKKGPIQPWMIDLYLDGGTTPKGKEVEGKPLPSGVVGLRPYGNRKILWRFTGPVFEDGPMDLQQKSIVARNLSEEGFDTISQMRILFPDKTEKEIDKMLGGVPFRRISNTLGIVNNLIGLSGQMMQTPDLLDPAMPMALKYGQFIDQMIFILFQKMLMELQRGQDGPNVYDSDPGPFAGRSGIPSDPNAGAGSTPNSYLQPGPAGQLPYPGFSGNGTANVPMAGGAPDQRNSVSSTGLSPSGSAAGLLPPELYSSAAGPGPNGLPANGQLQQPDLGRWQPFSGGAEQGIGTTGQPGSQPLPEFVSPIPGPGTVVQHSSPTRPTVYGQQPWSPHQQPVYGQSDLQSQPGLLAQLFPSFTAAARAVSPKRRKSNKR